MIYLDHLLSVRREGGSGIIIVIVRDDNYDAESIGGPGPVSPGLTLSPVKRRKSQAE